jgi:hypothetical protein
MDILSEHRISAIVPSEHELALHAERARIARERTPQRRTLRELLGRRAPLGSPVTAPIRTITGPVRTITSH